MLRSSTPLRAALSLAFLAFAVDACATGVIVPGPDTAPVVQTTQVSSNLLSTGSAVDFTATFVDPDLGQTFSALIDWNDGTTTAGTLSANPNGTYNVVSSHVYAQPGVYTITVAVSDGILAGGATSEYVVVFDPGAGFVTGGGWIDSPAGAYAADPTLTGHANFGFVSKYLPGAQVPSGNTEFNFQTARLNFHSTSYQWLVVAGAKATYRGSGTINQQGDYRFVLTAIDGQVTGGGGVDRVRLQIWDATGGVIYDNQAGATTGADPVQPINGSIVIHK